MDYRTLQSVCAAYQAQVPILANEVKAAKKLYDDAVAKQGEISKYESKKDMKQFNIELNNITNLILNQSSKQIRDVARVHFEKIVTDALQFITQDTNYKFVIEDNPQLKKPSYEFFIESMVNGQLSRQKPEDACGGGFVDIISVTSKYAYWQIFKDPEIKNASSLLDEPGKMVSEQMSVRFAEFIRFLGKKFGKQTIMITHNDNYANVADQTFYVRKDRSGVSRVTIGSLSSTVVSVQEVMDGILSENADGGVE